MEEILRWQRQISPVVTLEDILSGVPRANLNALDLDLLEALVRYNFFTSEQGSRLYQVSQRAVEKRWAHLYQWGLIDRAPLPSATRGGRCPMVFALSQSGFLLLKRLENEMARTWADDWQPKSETGSQRLAVFHELGRNDVCIAICETAKALGNPVVDWEGPREAGQRFIANPVTHEWHRIDPDAVLRLSTGQPLFIEYERSGRNSKFQSKVRQMRNYLVSGQWQTRYAKEPWVVYAIPPGLGTQGVIGGSYGGMAIKAEMSGARNYLLLDAEAWTSGTWMATRGDGSVVNFWEAIKAS